MYGRRSQSGSGILLMVVLGIFAGAVFVVKDWVAAPGAPAEPVPATQIPTPLPPTVPAAEPTSYAVAQYRLLAPTIGVSAPIVELVPEGTTWNVSYLGGANVGHLHGTASLEERGNKVLVGHVEMPDGNGGVFKALEEVKVGDPLVVRINDQERWYVVRELRTVAPDDLSVLYPTSGDQLTLITCDDYDFLAGAYQSRFIVIADAVA